MFHVSCALGLAAFLGADGLHIPDGCVGMGGFCKTDADCRSSGRVGSCGNDSRCYQTCGGTATRSAGEIPRLHAYCCDYGTETPLVVEDGEAKAVPLSQKLPKHWGEPRFKGKRVLVTGGDSGIGFAAVQAFYLECAEVLLVGHSENKSKAAHAAIGGLPVPPTCADSPPKVSWASADVSNASQAEGLVTKIVTEFGGLDIAVNNAGTVGNKAVQIGDAGFVAPDGLLYDQTVLDVNVGGTLKCMNAEIQHWLRSGTEGVMINVASICGETAYCPPMYLSSKWAMIGFTKQAALTYARKGIRINALAPGTVNTTMLRGGMSPNDPRWRALLAELERVIPNGRVAEPWEMAGPITFLASDMSSYVVGAVLTADGDVTQTSPWHLPHGGGDVLAGSAWPLALSSFGPVADVVV